MKYIYIIVLFFSISCSHKDLYYEGYVKDVETGDPLVGVQIDMFAQDKEDLIRKGKDEPIRTTSDDNGYYRIKITEYNKPIRIVYSYYIYQFLLKDTIISDSIRNDIKVANILMDIDSQNGYALYRGNIKDKDTSKPLSGVSVNGYTETNKNGNYVIKLMCMDTTEINLSFEKTGYVTVQQEITAIPNTKNVISEILMKQKQEN